MVSCTTNHNNKIEEKTKKHTEIAVIPDNRAIAELSIDGDDIMYEMTLYLFQQFSQNYPNAKGQIAFSSSLDAIEKLKRNEVDIVMSACNCSYIKDIELECIPIAKDFLTLIVNFNNIALQQLALHGLSRNSLQKIYFNQITEWNSLSSNKDNIQPIAKYLPNKNSGAINHISTFLNADAKKMKAINTTTEQELLANILNIPISIGFCSHTISYDPQSKLRRQGIYIIGIDYNNSGTLNDEELIYDELSDLKKAVKKGEAPSELVRELSFLYNPNSEKIEDIKLFINFAKQNQKSLLEKFNFFDIN